MEEIKFVPIDKARPAGLRCRDRSPLSAKEIDWLKEEIRSISADESVFAFDDPQGKARYDQEKDIIYVTRHIFPDTSVWPESPFDQLTPRALLALLYYGHRARAGKDDKGEAWKNKALQALNTALNAPGLSQFERAVLLMDAAWHAAKGFHEFILTEDLKEIAYGKWVYSSSRALIPVDEIEFIYRPELRDPFPPMSGACIPERRRE